MQQLSFFRASIILLLIASISSFVVPSSNISNLYKIIDPSHLLRAASNDNNSDNNDVDNSDNNSNNELTTIPDLQWRVEALRLDTVRIRKMMKSKPRFLPYSDAQKWVAGWGR